MSSPATGVVIRAAGGLLWRLGPDGLEIAAVHRPRYDDWSMPKGKLHDGEHPLHAACREVFEETCVRPKVGRRLPQQEYALGPDRKTVDYWDMTARAGDEFVATDEVDALRWLRPAEAATVLSYERDQDLLSVFLTVPPPTAMVLLVRHAKAGERTSWPGDDRFRPLDPDGMRQAEALRAPLKWFGPDRILSAEQLRCLQTVAPLAEDLGLPVESEPAFSELAYAGDSGRALRRVIEIATEGGRAVVCSQREVIPDLVSTLAARGGLRPGRVAAGKASVWALSFVDDRVVAADYYPDLAGSRAD